MEMEVVLDVIRVPHSNLQLEPPQTKSSLQLDLTTLILIMTSLVKFLMVSDWDEEDLLVIHLITTSSKYLSCITLQIPMCLVTEVRSPLYER